MAAVVARSDRITKRRHERIGRRLLANLARSHAVEAVGAAAVGATRCVHNALNPWAGTGRCQPWLGRFRQWYLANRRPRMNARDIDPDDGRNLAGLPCATLITAFSNEERRAVIDDFRRAPLTGWAGSRSTADSRHAWQRCASCSWRSRDSSAVSGTGTRRTDAARPPRASTTWMSGRCVAPSAWRRRAPSGPTPGAADGNRARGACAASGRAARPRDDRCDDARVSLRAASRCRRGPVRGAHEAVSCRPLRHRGEFIAVTGAQGARILICLARRAVGTMTILTRPQRTRQGAMRPGSRPAGPACGTGSRRSERGT